MTGDVHVDWLGPQLLHGCEGGEVEAGAHSTPFSLYVIPHHCPWWVTYPTPPSFSRSPFFKSVAFPPSWGNPTLPLTLFLSLLPVLGVNRLSARLSPLCPSPPTPGCGPAVAIAPGPHRESVGYRNSSHVIFAPRESDNQFSFWVI